MCLALVCRLLSLEFVRRAIAPWRSTEYVGINYVEWPVPEQEVEQSYTGKLSIWPEGISHNTRYVHAYHIMDRR